MNGQINSSLKRIQQTGKNSIAHKPNIHSMFSVQIVSAAFITPIHLTRLIWMIVCVWLNKRPQRKNICAENEELQYNELGCFSSLSDTLCEVRVLIFRKDVFHSFYSDNICCCILSMKSLLFKCHNAIDHFYIEVFLFRKMWA